jgi:heptosyltransferase I
MGDTVILSPVLRDIASAFPEAELLLFSGGANASLTPLFPFLSPVPIELGNPRKAIATIRSQHVDVLLDFDSWPRVEAVYGVFSGARFSAGFRAPGQHRHYAFDAWVDHRPKTHELDNYRSMASVLGVQSTSLPEIQPPGLLTAEDRPPGPYVVLHMWPAGFRSELKRWAPERWRALAAELIERGNTVVISGGPRDIADSAAWVASAQLPAERVVDLTGRFGLGPVCDLLGGAQAVISVNTGIMHLAAATGVPTLSLNGPTDAERWGPVGRRVVSVDSCLTGCGYLYYGWEYKGQRLDCMDGISVEQVLDALAGQTS